MRRRMAAIVVALLLLAAWPRAARSQNSLDCTFDSGSDNFCNWLNDADDDFDWRTGSSVAVDGFHSIPRTVTGSGKFAYAQGRFRPAGAAANARAILRSPEITGLTVAGTLSFNYWKTAFPPRLQVCTREKDATDVACLDRIVAGGPQSWSRRVVTIPASPSTFTIVLIASNFNSGLDLLGVDDIQFRVQGQQVDGAQGYWTSADRPGAPQPPPASLQSYNPNSGQRPDLGLISPPGTIPNRVQSYRPAKSEIPAAPKLQKVDPASLNQPEGGHPISFANGGGQLLRKIPLPPIVVASTAASAARGGGGVPLSPKVSFRVGTDLQNVKGDGIKTTVEDSQSNGACPAVACQFALNMCHWQPVLQSNYDWHLKNAQSEFMGIPGDLSKRSSYLFVDGDARYSHQKAAIFSEEFVVPLGAYLLFDIYISDFTSGRVSIYQTDRGRFQQHDPFAAASLIWQATGYGSLGARGWNRAQVPVRGASYPIAIIMSADDLSSSDHYIGLDDITLVDENGFEIGCAYDVTKRRGNLIVQSENSIDGDGNTAVQAQRAPVAAAWQQQPSAGGLNAAQQRILGALAIQQNDNALRQHSTRRFAQQPQAQAQSDRAPRVIRIEPLGAAAAAARPAGSVQHHTVVGDGLDVAGSFVGAKVWHSVADGQSGFPAEFAGAYKHEPQWSKGVIGQINSQNMNEAGPKLNVLNRQYLPEQQEQHKPFALAQLQQQVQQNVATPPQRADVAPLAAPPPLPTGRYASVLPVEAIVSRPSAKALAWRALAQEQQEQLRQVQLQERQQQQQQLLQPQTQQQQIGHNSNAIEPSYAALTQQQVPASAIAPRGYEARRVAKVVALPNAIAPAAQGQYQAAASATSGEKLARLASELLGFGGSYERPAKGDERYWHDLRTVQSLLPAGGAPAKPPAGTL